jgi:cobalt-precorrin 5A hydrolase/precorrin-3B C17-methyltransferase
MKKGMVTFAGAGPGAVDLLTLRCRDAIAEADVIVYAGSLVNPDVLAFARDDAEIHDSAGMTLEQTTRVLVDACRADRKALRLHTGDPSVYGAIAEQIVELDRAGVGFDVIPGVSAVFAAAATLGCELTLPGSSQTVILTRRAGRTPVPEGQDLRSLAAHAATMGLYLSVSDMPGLVEELVAGGYAPSTPVAVVYRASWPDEQTVRGTLADIAERVAASGIARQALVLVGEALSGAGERSRLYAPDFSHGYRTARAAAEPRTTASREIARAPFLGRVAVYGLTAQGCETARRIAGRLGADAFVSRKHAAADDLRPFDPVRIGDVLAAEWSAYDAHVLVMASGIAVRKIAPLLADKTTDPAVVVCDERGDFAVSLVGGHIGGANRLCRHIADCAGATPVISTATDVQGIPAFDEIAALQGWRVVNPPAIKVVNSALLQKLPVGFVGPAGLVERYYGADSRVKPVAAGAPAPADAAAIVLLDAEAPEGCDVPVLRFEAQPLVVGIGCRRNTAAREIADALAGVLETHGLAAERVARLASADIKRDEPGLVDFAGQRGLPVSFFSSDELGGVSVPTPSAMPAKHVGTPSVAEAAALLAGGSRLLVPKQIRGNVTVAVAVCETAREGEAPVSPSRGRLVAVGIGSGAPEGMTHQARQALREADVVVGYKVYTEQVASLTVGKRILASGMRKEVDRCREAIAEALAGRNVAVVCSGDAGVYGMAGLLLQLLADDNRLDDVDLVVVPGVTAALSAAAALGAPLMNDFAVVSLSDLLTDRGVILDRLKAVASAGIPCVLYNPRSTKRKELFDEALRIFGDAAGADLACGLVRNAGRPGETTWAGPLNELPVEDVDMFTTVILGGRETSLLHGKLVTARGYKARGKT